MSRFKRAAIGFAAMFVFPAVLSAEPPPVPAATPATSTTPAMVPILIYHSVREYTPRDSAASRRYIITPRALEAELKFLKAGGYVSIGFDDLAAYVEKGRPLPEPCVIISLDDGWESQYKTAFPLLRKYGFRATFFIFTNAIGKKHFMSLAELRSLRDAGMWIGSHSLSHPYLTRIKNRAALRRQIFDSKRILEEKLGEPVTAFAYPFGQYNKEIVSLVRQAGYTTARGTYFGVRHSRGDLFTLTGLINVTSSAKVVAELDQAAKIEKRERPLVPPPGIDPGEYN